VKSSYTLSSRAEKFNLKTPLVLSALDAGVALGWDLLELCGECEDLELCLVLSLTPTHQGDILVDVVGVHIQLDENRLIDWKTTLLFKHANYIVKEGGLVSFYMDKSRSLGVYYAICSDSGVAWSTYRYPSSEVLAYVSGGDDQA
jgi:hypothetical protein